MIVKWFTRQSDAPLPGRAKALEALSAFSRWAARACAAGAALCLVTAVAWTSAALDRFPAPISQVLSWECVGEGAQFNGQTTYPIYAYLVEDSYLQSQDDGVPRGAVGGRYLLFDWDATVPLAEEASRVLTALLGALLLAYGGRFFWGVERAGTPFTAESARRLKGAGGIAIAAAVVPNAVGLLISSLAQTYHLTPVGAWKIGVWNVGVTTGLTLALGVLLIALGIAFDYGVVLQQQDDELL